MESLGRYEIYGPSTVTLHFAEGRKTLVFRQKRPSALDVLKKEFADEEESRNSQLSGLRAA